MSKKFDILIIDDEKVIVDAVNKICATEGLNVDTSTYAPEAMEKIKNNSYKILLCDIMMPEIDGFQILDEVIKRGLDSPLIMTTGFSTVENAVKSLYNGAIDFIPKPFTSDELLSSILRGLKYFEIQQKIKSTEKKVNDSSIIYVPCPAKYYRLGYASWAYEDQSGSILVGVTDLFLRTIESVAGIDLLKVDEEIVQGNTCAQIKTPGELYHSMLSPVTGRILERNEELLKDVNLIEKDPYFEGWIYRLIPSDSEYELKQLVPCSSDRL